MSSIFTPAVVEVNLFGADLFSRDPEPVASVGHPAEERDGRDWDAMAEDAAAEAAWEAACENGHGAW